MSETVTYNVPAIHCAHCGESIQEEVTEVEGVEEVDVDIDAKIVTIRGRELSDEKLRARSRMRGTRPRDDGEQPRSNVQLEIEGMTCASCAARVERKLNKLDGVEATGQLRDRAGDGPLRPGPRAVDELVGAVEAAGYGAQRSRRAPRPDQERARALRLRLVVAAALTRPLVLLAMVPPLQFDGWEWLALALATPVVLWGGWPFHRAALRTLRHGAATMDTLISIGTLAAWGWSVVALARVARGATRTSRSRR